MNGRPATKRKDLTADAAGGRSLLRILSFNIVVGLHTSRPHHYLTHAWRHLLPSIGMHKTLDRIAALASAYDVVAVQEADAGSLRTRFVNQIAYLAEEAGFPYWQTGINRDLGLLGQHCLGVLSRLPLTARHHVLPSRIPGRGLLDVALDHPTGPLRLIVAHLSLTRAARAPQLEYIAGLAETAARVVVVGDLNCDPHELLRHAALHRAGLKPQIEAPTYPSWRPRRCFDQALVRGNLQVVRAEVLLDRLSDHLPIALQLDLTGSSL